MKRSIAGRFRLIIAVPYNEQSAMPEQHFNHLEQHLQQLIQQYQKLQRENRDLRKQITSLQEERSQLRSVAATTEQKVEAMITRLKTLEQQA